MRGSRGTTAIETASNTPVTEDTNRRKASLDYRHTYDNSPIRLRGGADRPEQFQTPMSSKRMRVGSEEPLSPAESAKTVNRSLDNMDKTMLEIRSFVTDMIKGTKIGKKWQAGIERYLEENQIDTRVVVSATIIGQYSEVRSDLKDANFQIANLNMETGGYKRDIANLLKTKRDRTYSGATPSDAPLPVIGRMDPDYEDIDMELDPIPGLSNAKSIVSGKGESYATKEKRSVRIEHSGGKPVQKIPNMRKLPKGCSA